MEIKRSRLQFDPLKKGESKKLCDDGFIVRKIDNEKRECCLAPEIASFSVGTGNFSEIKMTQISKGDVVRDVNTGIFQGVSDDESICLLYWIDVIIFNIGFRQNEKYFTELSEAIDYYNKIKTFLKAEVNH